MQKTFILSLNFFLISLLFIQVEASTCLDEFENLEPQYSSTVLLQHAKKSGYTPDELLDLNPSHKEFLLSLGVDKDSGLLPANPVVLNQLVEDKLTDWIDSKLGVYHA
ncbi:hypothetical protein N9O57_01585 [bacterium]|nr:hypothetical protein [bacterium]